MKPPPFEYLRAASLAEAVAALAEDDAKVLAGGQSLIPLLSLRLARPSVLVDIADLGLDGLSVGPSTSGGAGVSVGPSTSGERWLRIGAMVTQRRLELDPLVAAAVPLLATAASHVGYPSTRNRGTLGGSLAHADPVAELPAVAVALGGMLTAVGASGSRELCCEDLAEGYFSTVLDADEIVTEIRLPVAGGRHGAAWEEWSSRFHDFAEAGVGVALDLDAGGVCTAVHAAACGIGRRPLAHGDTLAGAGLLGAATVTAPLLRAVQVAVTAACGPGDDDRAELAGLLAARAAVVAWEHAGRKTLRRDAA